MRRKLRPMLFDDEHLEAAQDQHRSVVALAKASTSTQRKARTKRTPDGDPVHSLHTLLEDLVTFAQNTVKPRLLDTETFKLLTQPTPIQKKAFKLLVIIKNVASKTAPKSNESHYYQQFTVDILLNFGLNCTDAFLRQQRQMMAPLMPLVPLELEN